MPLPPAQQRQGGSWNRLHDADDSGSGSRTTALLSRGFIDIDERGPMGWTPLMLAVQGGHVRVASMLVSKGANLKLGNNAGFTALLLATQHGHLAITNMLMKAGADIETATSRGSTPLHIAALNGHYEVMGVLIQAGANANSRTPDGVTPLYLAAQLGCVEVIRELLLGEANPLLTSRTPSGESVPLHVAVEQGHSEVARELIHQVGIEGCCGESDAVEALSLATKEGHVDIMAMLTEAGVIDTGEGLLDAAGNGLEASVKLLLQQQKEKGETTGGGAYVNFRGSLGATPLQSCVILCKSCSPRVARLLVDAGADTTSEVRMTGDGVDTVLCGEGTPLGITNMCLSDKQVVGKPATEEQLHRLEAIRRLLLQVEAVHAVSWLWPSGISFVAHAAEVKIKAKTASTPLTVMLPILRRRARRRGVLLSALFRYSSKPEPGFAHVGS